MKNFFKSLTGKITVVLLMITLPAIIGLFSYSHVIRNNWRQQQIRDVEQEAGLYATAMDRELSLVENAVLNLPFYNNALDTLQRTEPSESQAYWGIVLQARQYLDSITPIFRFLENTFAYYPQSKLFLNNQINPQLTASICAKAEQSEIGSCSWSCISTDSGNYLCLLYSVHSYYLGVWLSCDSLLNYICSADNTIAFPKTSLYYMTDLENHPLTVVSAAVSEDSLKITNLVRHPGLYLNRLIPSAALETRDAWYHGSPTVVALLFLVLLVAVILSITHWVLIPIHSISAGIEKISSGDIGFRLSAGEKVSLEFAQITTAFNQMIDRLETMRIRIYEQELDQNETKLRYLSQQIQPHFILNSLNTLYTYSNRDVNETRKIIRLLSGYYRYVVNIESRYVMLEQELAHVEDYLSLQKIRFPKRLNYSISCEDEAKAVPIPPFILESFISNALKYGQNEHGEINISIEARQTEPFVTEIRVSDQGMGFPDEVLEAIRIFRESGKKTDDLGIGIANCMERLSLIYQDRAQIVCENKDSVTERTHGANVIITIHLAEHSNAKEIG